jgi:pathogenesis-related protein 1
LKIYSEYLIIIIYIGVCSQMMKRISLVLLALAVCQGRQAFEEEDRKNGIYSRDGQSFQIGDTKCIVHLDDENQFNNENNKCAALDQYYIGRIGYTCGKSTVVPPLQRGNCPDAQDVLDVLNAVRSRWGADPLLWSEWLATVAQIEADTCQFQSSENKYGVENGTVYGETMVRALDGTMSCKTAMDLILQYENSYENLGANPSDLATWNPDTAAFAQAVWKGSISVGCAKSSCSDGDVFVCEYRNPGNIFYSDNLYIQNRVGYLGQLSPCDSSSFYKD